MEDRSDERFFWWRGEWSLCWGALSVLVVCRGFLADVMQQQF